MLYTYSLRSHWARRTDTLVAIAIVGLVGWASLTSATFARQYHQLVNQAGRADNALIVTKSATEEAASFLDKSMIDALYALPGLREKDGRPLVSPEVLAFLNLRAEGVGAMVVALRGVEAAAFELRPQLRVEGRRPHEGAEEVLVGRQASRLFGLALGDSVKVGGKAWPVVGIFDAEHSQLEREVWTSRAAAGVAFRREGEASAVTVGLGGPGALDELTRQLTSRPALAQLGAFEEAAFRAGQDQALRVAVKTAAWVIAAVTLGALFATMSALQATVLRRMRELGTLVVLGFRRNRVAGLVLVESVLLAAFAGALSALAVAPLASLLGLDRLFASSVAVDFSLTPELLGSGVAFGALVGLVGAAYPAISVLRMNILETVRG